LLRGVVVHLLLPLIKQFLTFLQVLLGGLHCVTPFSLQLKRFLHQELMVFTQIKASMTKPFEFIFKSGIKHASEFGSRLKKKRSGLIQQMSNL
jgi:hypothetical protein